MHKSIKNLSNNFFDYRNYPKREVIRMTDYLIRTISILCRDKSESYHVSPSTERTLKDFGFMVKRTSLKDIKDVLGGKRFHALIRAVNTVKGIDYYKIGSIAKFSFGFRQASIEKGRKSDKPTMVDLFCGSGGLSLGMNQSGFKTVFANDIDRPSLQTYLFNRPDLDGHHVILGDIKQVINDIRNHVPNGTDLVVGGPPCQGFSMANRQRIIDDPRNVLYKYYVKAIKELNPKIFVMENVKGMLKASNQVIEDLNSSVGVTYRISCKLLNAKDFGIPQNRERLIFIGIRKDIAESNHVNASDIFMRLINKERQLVPLKSALYGLRPLKASRIRNSTTSGDESSGHVIEKNEWDVTNRYLDTINHDQIFDLVYNHKARYNNRRDRKIYGLMKPGDRSDSPRIWKIMPYKSRKNIFKDKYFKLLPDKPCKTITAHMKYDCNMYVHPTQARGLTPREAARIQSYPDDYFFLGAYTKTYQQIGNSVPPLLSKNIGEELIKLLI